MRSNRLAEQKESSCSADRELKKKQKKKKLKTRRVNETPQA